MTYHYSSTKILPTTTTGTTSSSTPSTPATSTTSTSGLVAPAGYHYMPDGTLMSDADHDRLYGSKSVRPGNEVVLKKDILDIEKRDGIVINKGENLVLTYGDIDGISPDPIYRADRTIFKMNCAIEKIPAPKINRVLGLNAFPRNLVTKKQVDKIIVGDSASIIEEIDYPSKYIKSVGGSISLTPTGDVNASYVLVAQDTTNTKWYNWETLQFENGYSEKQGYVGFGSCQLVIPPQSQETKYHLYFKNKSSLKGDNGKYFTTSGIGDNPINAVLEKNNLITIPTQDNPWSIFQLPKATTTIRFKEEPNFITGEQTIITRDPLVSMFDKNSISNGEVSINLTVLSKRGKMVLIDNETKINQNVELGIKSFESSSADEDRSTIVDSDLNIKINSDQSTATISGTIIFEKSSLRDSNFEIDPSNFLKIAE